MCVALPLVAAVIGLFAGLVVGGVAAFCIVALVLSASGHAHPMDAIDAAFTSRPMGWSAFVIITTYTTTALVGAFLSYRRVRLFALRVQPLAHLDDSSQKAELLERWIGVSRGRKAVLMALLVLTAAVSLLNFFHYQWAIEQASRVPTVERPVSINDHGHELYVTAAQQRLIAGGAFAMFALTTGLLGYAFYVLRFSEFLSQGFQRGLTSDDNS